MLRVKSFSAGWFPHLYFTILLLQHPPDVQIQWRIRSPMEKIALGYFWDTFVAQIWQPWSPSMPNTVLLVGCLIIGVPTGHKVCWLNVWLHVCTMNTKVSLGTCFPPGAIWHLSVSRGVTSDLNITNKCVRCNFEYELWRVNLRVDLGVWIKCGFGLLFAFHMLRTMWRICLEIHAFSVRHTFSLCIAPNNKIQWKICDWEILSSSVHNLYFTLIFFIL